MADAEKFRVPRMLWSPSHVDDYFPRDDWHASNVADLFFGSSRPVEAMAKNGVWYLAERVDGNGRDLGTRVKLKKLKKK